MLRNRRIGLGGGITVALAILLVTASPADADTYYWSNNANVNGNWSIGADWYDSNTLNTGTVPGSADTAYVANGGTATIDGTTGTAGVSTLNIGSGTTYAGNGTLNLNTGGILSVGSGGIVNPGGTATFNLNGGTLQAGATFSTALPMTLYVGTNSTIDPGAGSSGITLNGVLSGSGGLTYGAAASTGTVIINNINTYTGSTAINGGEVLLGYKPSASATNPFGATTSTLTLNGGTLSASNHNGANYIYVSNPYVIGGNITLGDTVNPSASFQFTMRAYGDITNNPTITVNPVVTSSGAPGSVTLGFGYYNLVDDGGGFTKAGAGKLVLAGLTTSTTQFTGPIVVNGGILQFGASNDSTYTVGTPPTITVNSGGSISAGTNNVFYYSNVVLNGTGALIGAAALGYGIQVGSLGGTSTPNIDLSTFALYNNQHPFFFQEGYTNASTTFNGTFSDTAAYVAAIIKSGTGSWTLGGQSTLNGVGGNTSGFEDPHGQYSGAIGTYSGAISAVLWNGALVAGASSIQTAGTVTSGPFGRGTLMICGNYNGFGGNVTLTGNSTGGYTIANPTLLMGGTASGAAAATGAITLGDSSNDALNLSGAATLAGLVGTGGSTAFVPIAMTLYTPGNGVMTISGPISEAAGAEGSSIIKDGNGTLVLSGNNTYTGLTTVKAGVLVLVDSSLPIIWGLFGPIWPGAFNPILSGGSASVQGGKLIFDYTGGSDPWSWIDPLLNTSRLYAASGNPPLIALDDTATNQVTVESTLYGDADEDGTVNGADLDIVLSNYNKTGMGWAQGDFDGNGTVNGIDLNTVLSNYNKQIGVSAAVPEPGTLGMLALGAVGVLAWKGWRKRK